METVKLAKSLASNKTFEASTFAVACFSVFVGLMVLLNTYTVPGLPFLGFDELLFVVSLPFFLYSCRKKTVFSKKSALLIAFCAYSGLISLFSTFLIENNVLNVFSRVMREAFYYVIIFWLGNNLFSVEIFKKVFSKIVLVLAAFVLVQAIVYYFTGYFIPGLLFNATLNDNSFTGREMYVSLLANADVSGYLKPNGFLAEPSTCAHCFFIYLLVVLFDSKDKGRRFWKAILVSLAMVATMSTSAFVELIFGWLLWLFYAKRKICLIILAVLLVSLPTVISVVSYSDSVFGSVAKRLFDAFSEDRSGLSSGLRVTRGFKIFASLSVGHKVFGIGFGSYEAAVESGVIGPSSVPGIENEYMNSLSYLLISSGIIGFLLFALYYTALYKTRDKFGRALILSLAFLFLGTSTYCSSLFVFVLLLTLASEKSNYGRSLNS